MVSKEQVYRQFTDSTDFGPVEQQLLKDYLAGQVERYDRGDGVPNDLAYEIAGLMGTNALWTLPRDNPFMKVLLLAGYLELPDAHHEPDDTWDNLKELIAQLP